MGQENVVILRFSDLLMFTYRQEGIVPNVGHVEDLMTQ